MFLNALEIGIENPSLAFLLYNSMKEYKNIEEIFKKECSAYSFYNSLNFKNSSYKESEYFEKNFFSIFFISLYKSAGFDKTAIEKYGTIFHMARTIITATDNMLDNEEKGPLVLSSLSNLTIKNVILILISNRILNSCCSNKASSIKLTNTLYKIACGETISKIYEETSYPSSEFIRKEIHENIGGELLGIAFDVPIIEEPSIAPMLSTLRTGIVMIGNSLQALDDMTDVLEDINFKKANLLTSIIIEQKKVSYQEILKNQENIFELYKEQYLFLIKESIENAINGFKIIESTGYPINIKSANNILKLMFKLRGLKKEWKLYEDYLINDH